MSKCEKFLFGPGRCSQALQCFPETESEMCVDTRPSGPRGAEGPGTTEVMWVLRVCQGQKQYQLSVTHLESRAGPGLLWAMQGWSGQQSALPPLLPLLPAPWLAWQGWSALPNTRPHSPPKINILYRHLVLLLHSPHGALCHWLRLILGFLKDGIWLSPTLVLSSFPCS